MSGLVLASLSPTRARLLAEAGVAFSIKGSGVDEQALKAQSLADGHDPRRIAEALSQAKALAVSPRIAALVIGADQTLDLDGRLFDKPASLAEARAQLLRLRGTQHQLHSAVTLARGDAVIWREVGTVTLRMRAFSDAFLDAYLADEGDELLACVGAYRLEGRGAQLFDVIEGDYFSVLGLPLLPLLAALRTEGYLAS